MSSDDVRGKFLTPDAGILVGSVVPVKIGEGHDL